MTFIVLKFGFYVRVWAIGNIAKKRGVVKRFVLKLTSDYPEISCLLPQIVVFVTRVI